MQRFRRTLYVCTSCIQRLQRGPYVNAVLRETFIQARHAHNNAPAKERPFRLAVIGSGPAGFYAAYRVMQKIQDAVVDMYEHLPVPYGLVRYGVAPDHPEVKNCEDKFEEVASSPRFDFIGNIDVGHDIPLTLLKPHYDAMLFAYGASKDKRLGIPGEDLKDVYSARAFVGWYNGLPDYADLNPNLEAGEQAVIIGQGNVALDVARILLGDVDALRKTDITEHALEALSRSKVKSVQVVGRRGPMQAAFTIKEARELLTLPGVSFSPIDPAVLPPDPSKLPRQQKRIAQLLAKGSSTPEAAAGKHWALRFLLSPSAFNPSDSEPSTLRSVSFRQNKFAQGSDPSDRSARVEQSGEGTELPAALAFRSVGYKSTPLPGLSDLGVPFDEAQGIIPNDLYGRVLNPEKGPGSLTAGHVPGMYCAGWVKRGPTGVIASTMDDAFISADVIAKDWEQGVKFLNGTPGAGMRGSSGLGWDGIRAEAIKRGLRPVSWAEWKRINEAEKGRGRAKGKGREKFTRIEDMLKVLDG